MIFGVYPGSVAGDDEGGLAAGPPDDADAIARSLAVLQGVPGRPMSVRAYLSYTDDTDPTADHPTLTPADARRYLGEGRSLDLVAQFQSRSGDVRGFCTFLTALVDQYGTSTSTLQVTEEPNVAGLATLDGDYPSVREALTAGVRAVKRAARTNDLEDLRVGFNTTPLFGPAESFLTDLVATGGAAFVDALDYVGLDFFPDVFRPVDRSVLAESVTWLLRRHRRDFLDPAGLAAIPLHVTEHGWPTGPGRDPERQAEVVDTVVRTISSVSDELDVRAYTHFGLRDADSSRDTLFHRFGLLTDTYDAKPAFAVYASLIRALTGRE